jgi:hypothetical protein
MSNCQDECHDCYISDKRCFNKVEIRACDRCSGREHVEVQVSNYPGQPFIGTMCTKCGCIEKQEGDN